MQLVNGVNSCDPFNVFAHPVRIDLLRNPVHEVFARFPGQWGRGTDDHESDEHRCDWIRINKFSSQEYTCGNNCNGRGGRMDNKISKV